MKTIKLNLPENIERYKQQIRNYLQTGNLQRYSTFGFILQDDLYSIINYKVNVADDQIQELTKFILDNFPKESYGSEENVEKWINARRYDPYKVVFADEDNDYRLHLNVVSGMLQIGFHEVNTYRIIGYISNCRLRMLENDHNIKNYEKWREKGRLIDETKVEYIKYNYCLTKSPMHGIIMLRNSTLLTNIYSFELCESEPGCLDDQILRHKHNRKPV